MHVLTEHGTKICKNQHERDASLTRCLVCSRAAAAQKRKTRMLSDSVYRESQLQYVRNWRRDNPDWQKNYKLVNKEKLAQQRRTADLFRKYGLTTEDYDSFVSSQHGRCAICKELPTGSNCKNGILSVDHNHTTNEVRGLLCDSCNMGLGKFSDNPQILREAANYVENTTGN